MNLFFDDVNKANDLLDNSPMPMVMVMRYHHEVGISDPASKLKKEDCKRQIAGAKTFIMSADQSMIGWLECYNTHGTSYEELGEQDFTTIMMACPENWNEIINA